jgi:hypothetical protein
MHPVQEAGHHMLIIIVFIVAGGLAGALLCKPFCDPPRDSMQQKQGLTGMRSARGERRRKDTILPLFNAKEM